MAILKLCCILFMKTRKQTEDRLLKGGRHLLMNNWIAALNAYVRY